MKNISFIAFLFTLVSCAQTTFAANDNSTKYYAIFDCGSSGTRIYLYQNAHNEPKLIAEEKNNIQLDTHLDTPKITAKNNIRKLIAQIKPMLKQHNIDKKKLQIDILATAGMRYVPTEVQAQYYAQIKQNLLKSGYNVNQARTISGNEEAIYSWISANHLNHILDSQDDTYGIIEVGGASAQIAFATSQESGDNIYKIKTNKQTYNLYNISFLGLGKNRLYSTLTQNNESGICDAKQNSYTDCEQTISSVINSYPETSQIKNINGFKETKFYGIDNVYNFKGALANNFSSVNSCKTLNNKDCATNIYIRKLIDTVAPNSLTPISKINSTTETWTSGYVYSEINNIKITH